MIRGNVSPQVIAQNDANRKLFLSTAIRSSQTLPVQNFATGSNLTFELNSSGVLNYMEILFSGNINITGAGTGVPSKKDAYSLFPTIEFTDYFGVTRVKSSAFMLEQLENLDMWAVSQNKQVVASSYADSVHKFGPTLSVGDNVVNFSVKVPVMYGPNDCRGGIPLTVPNGKCYLKVGCSSNIYGANDDSVVVGTGYTAVTVTGTITVTQYTYQPEAIQGKVILPLLDLQEVHEINETTNTRDISPNMDKLFSLPTGREYHLILQQYFNGTAGLDTVDIDRIAFLLDGNTPTLDETLQAYLTRIRSTYGDDLPTGLFVHDFRSKPWDSTQWGQLQTKSHISSGATVNAGAYMSFLTKSLYIGSSQVLSGLSGVSA